MAKKKSSAFDVKLTEEQLDQLADEWCRDIDDAFSARSPVIQDGGTIDTLDWFYEQGRTDPRSLPFPGAADLTSYFITQSVDAMRARLMRSYHKAEPFCMVDGWGEDATKAAQVEAFHDWQVEEEGLLPELGKVIHRALIEDAYILEVRPRIETRRITEELDVAVETNEGGGVVFENSEPKYQFDGQGEPVPAQEGQAAARVKRTHTKTKQLGPEYDRISTRDFVFLPGHAKDQRECYGYAYRFFKRVPEVKELAADGVYDADAVEQLGETSERDEARTPVTVSGIAASTPRTAELELFQLSVKQDLDKDGREEWYLVTLSLKRRVILRITLDTFVMKVGKPRCVAFVPLPRADSVYGYSFAEKLLTLAEEHTAARNSSADRNALATNAPITVLQGAAWDPESQPWGVGRTITVRDHNELKQMQVSDVPQSSVWLMRDMLQANERLSGLSDVGSVGVSGSQSNTLGQDQLITAASGVRVEELLGNLGPAIVHLMQLRHQIWIDAMESDPKGLDAPDSVVQRLANTGSELNGGTFTSAMLKGKYRFRPNGSVHSADPNVRIQYFNNGMIALTNLAKTSPAIAALLNDPEVAARTLQEWGRAYEIRDIDVFVKALRNARQQQSMMGLPSSGGPGPGDPMHSDPTQIGGAVHGAPPNSLAMLAGLGGGVNGRH